jgi:pilus assembly protein FimV
MLWCFDVIDPMPQRRISVPNSRLSPRPLSLVIDSTTDHPGRGVGRSWRGVAIAAAVSCLLVGNAWALALGRVSVQSLLGEPLRAEIDVPALTDAEAATLQIGLASPERFRAANLDFNPLLQDVSLTLERRPDGSAAIILRSSRPVAEPFLDVMVQARWAGGELLRGYTLLFDPPNLRPVVPVESAIISAPPAPTVSGPPPAPPMGEARPLRSARAAAPTRADSDKPAATAAADRLRRIVVRPGDTAGRIAAAYKPADVTLEQMLVALLRANPNAFIRGNVHLLRAGAVIDLPDGAGAAPVDAQEARRIVAAQTRDFNEYRRRLARVAPRQEAPSATRSDSGTVQAAVGEEKPQASAQDRLTLSKPGASAAAEARIAEDRQRSESEQRVAELNRNLQELEQLRQAVTASESPPTPPSSAPLPETESPPATPAEPADATNTAAPTAAQTESPAPTLPAPAAAPTPAPIASTPTPDDNESGALATVLRHSWTVPAAAGLAALLAVLAWWRVQRRRAIAAAPTSEQAPQADTTPESTDVANTAPPPLVEDSLSHIDVGADTDPVAEAEVYLAYGRDQQAEEILQEALQADPGRLPVRLKLLEIYAQRLDIGRFEAAARELLALTGGEGAEWTRVCELGQSIDPDNPLYRPDTGLRGDTSGAIANAEPSGAAAAVAEAEVPELDLSSMVTEPSPLASSEEPTAADAGGLDFEIDRGTPYAESAPESVSPNETAARPTNTLDFDLELPPEQDPTSGAADDRSAMQSPVGLPPELAGLSLDLPTDEPAALADPSTLSQTRPLAAELPNGDLSNLEVEESPADADPLETKLSLAREFEAIGDIDGARTLAEEVLAEATGELQERARAFLAQLA